MRLIDADTLEECKEIMNTISGESKYVVRMDDIRNMPTIEERKTGKWVLAEMGDTNLYECSLCRNRKTHMTPFCDICGAKMESGDNNGTD